MKIHTLISLILCFACIEESAKKLSSGKQLIQITVNGKPDQIFEYDQSLLSKENVFNSCEQNPSDEYTYFYQNQRLSNISATLRGHYANSNAACDPSTGIHMGENFEYNSQDQINKIIRANSYSVLIYNTSGLVEKQIFFYGQNSLEANYTYDSRGNIIELTDFDGKTTKYAYDDKVNPYYQMKQRPGLIKPYNKSPNNVVKAKGAYNFERSFEYDAEGFPAKAFETNGLTYMYIYE